MKMAENRVLVVESSHALSTAYCNALEKAGYTPVLVETGHEAVSHIAAAAEDFAVILMDMALPDMDGEAVLERVTQLLAEKGATPAIVVMMVRGAARSAVTAMTPGVVDVILKPFDEETLSRTMKRAIAHTVRADAHDDTRDSIAQDGIVRPAAPEEQRGMPHDMDFIGDSTPMQTVYRAISQVARSSATVFITGESGTGKELCARAIHAQSSRRNRPFVAVHCASVPHDRIKSEIFGHVEGPFSQKTGACNGAVARAEGGTLLLDEIMEMDVEMQAKLLRFVQTHSYRPVGGHDTHNADIRIICTTNRDPLEELRAGRMREDLFYRLYVVPVHMPPLYARKGDVCQIARSYLQRCAAEEGKRFDGFDAEVEQVFMKCRWPGNIHQLHNVIRSIVVMQDGGLVTRDMLPANILAECRAGDLEGAAPGAGDTGPGVAMPGMPARAADIKPLWQSEKETIENAIALCDGNIPRAARHLQVSPSTIYRKRQSWKKDAGGKSGTDR